MVAEEIDTESKKTQLKQGPLLHGFNLTAAKSSNILRSVFEFAVSASPLGYYRC